MSQSDLFGNHIPSSKSPKKFKLTLEPKASSNDKKQKTKIYALVKKIEESQNTLIKIKQHLALSKNKYIEIMDETRLKLESQMITLIHKYLSSLKNDSTLQPWHKALLFYMILNKIQTYHQHHLNPVLLSDINNQLDSISNDKDLPEDQINPVEELHEQDGKPTSNLGHEHINLSQQPIDSTEFNNDEAVFNKFKKLYKHLVKKVHPDVLFYTSEENEKHIKVLTELWDQQAYYKLLELNHKINTDSIITLSTEDLRVILNQLEIEYSGLKKSLEVFKSSIDYTFYVEQFYNTSEHVITSKIDTYKNTMLNLIQNNHALILHYNTSGNPIKHYLNTHRQSISKALGITYYIEDLFGHSSS